MKKRNGVGEAIVLSTMAAGFMLLSPDNAKAAEAGATTDPLITKDEKFDTEQTLRYGHKGLSVKAIQIELMALDFYSSKLDGVYGRNTQQAIKEFQFVHHLKVDGIAGPSTLNKLFSSIDTKTYQQFTSTKLLNGDKGEQVRQLQEKLSRLGYFSTTIDGKFGPLTKGAVLDYQNRYGLKADGVADSTTLKHLFTNQNVRGKTITVRSVKKQTNFSVDTSIIKHATSLIGIPYKWGGTSPSGFDCSGFLQYVYSQKGYTIPRTVSDIWNFGVNVSKPSIGDLVFFQTYKRGPSHAGIYLGDGKFIHSGSKGVTVSSMNTSYWQERYLGSKRIVQYN
ncbi:peptidoglycan-binding protein [Bacillus suaedaesalsae]|uniref:Peptidoglycan-binding protein n=1 Tax=Bacillus suaedaesalsae TaxID=2810349 RepID=A0ABS2DLH7_9BACI|nr:peptidoglycan-binding protein [Bacillus suaedaesalsae]MBM6619345.1 peptidoglycan-binding protein [Bacillus suaedaesalsae]